MLPGEFSFVNRGPHMTDADREPTVLAGMPTGVTVEVVEYLGCRRRSQRLAELGMTPGTRLEILRTAPGQPLLLRVRGSLLAIDRRSARDVIVRPLEESVHALRPHAVRRRHGLRSRFGRAFRHARRRRER